MRHVKDSLQRHDSSTPEVQMALTSQAEGMSAEHHSVNISLVITQTVLEAGGSFAGVNRKVQLKPTKWSELEEGSTEQPHVVEALLILKHGGVLTHAGRQQASAAFRIHAFQQSSPCILQHSIAYQASLGKPRRSAL